MLFAHSDHYNKGVDCVVLCNNTCNIIKSILEYKLGLHSNTLPRYCR